MNQKVCCVALAQSLNMVEDVREFTFSQEKIIKEEKYLDSCQKAMDPQCPTYVNGAGHNNNPFGLEQALNPDGTRRTIKLGLGDKLRWAQFVGSRRNEDGSLASDEEEYIFFEAEVIRRDP